MGSAKRFRSFALQQVSDRRVLLDGLPNSSLEIPGDLPVELQALRRYKEEVELGKFPTDSESCHSWALEIPQRRSRAEIILNAPNGHSSGSFSSAALFGEDRLWWSGLGEM